MPGEDEKKDGLEKEPEKEPEKKEVKEEEKEKEDLIPRSMLEEAIDGRQAAKRKLREAMKKIDELESFKEKANELETKVGELSKLEETMKKIEKEKEEAELAKKTEAEKDAIKARKELESLRDEFQSKIDEAMKGIEKKDEAINSLRGEVKNLRSFKLENEIVAAAAKYKAINPNQIVRLLKGDFEYDDTDDNYYHNVRTKDGKLKDQIDVDAYVKNFLEEDSNSNLVSAGMKSGTGHEESSGGSKSTSMKIKTESKMFPHKDQLEDALKAWAKDRDYIWDDEKDRSTVLKMFERHGDTIFKA